jgi:hypothetical protein
LPRYASRLLARLVGPGSQRSAGTGPYTTVKELHAALAAVRHRPAEVTRGHRNTLLGAQVFLLAPGLLWLLLAGPLLVYFILGERLFAGLGIEASQEELQRDLALQSASLAAASDPFTRLSAAALVGDDLEAGERLRPYLVRVKREQRLALESAGWFHRRLYAAIQLKLRQVAAAEAEAEKQGFSTRAQAARYFLQQVDALEPGLSLDAGDWLGMAAFLATWPGLWVLWAFLFRGGLSYRLMGIALVQQDGRPPAGAASGEPCCSGPQSSPCCSRRCPWICTALPCSSLHRTQRPRLSSPGWRGCSGGWLSSCSGSMSGWPSATPPGGCTTTWPAPTPCRADCSLRDYFSPLLSGCISVRKSASRRGASVPSWMYKGAADSLLARPCKTSSFVLAIRLRK